MAKTDSSVIDWLLAGDASIRWQTMRDLLEAPAAEWEAERAKVPTEGVGARLVALQDPAGTWGGAIYAPKWTSTTYTLLLMRDMGFDGDCAAARRGGEQIMASAGRSKGFGGCTCMVGMYLALGVRFTPADPLQGEMVEHLLGQQLADGGWNCRWPRIAKTHHSSFHTTANVLDGFQEAMAAGVGPVDRLREAEARAIELLLQHRLFRSDKTGRIINPKFTELHFPYRWHYDILRGLDHIRSTPIIADPRLDEAFEVLLSHRREDGRWPAAKGYGGLTFFPIESGRDGSQWNTLRAMRCLKARAAQRRATGRRNRPPSQ